MTVTAYSYLRFSSAAQSWGDSRRRQMAMAERYADQHGLAIDTELTFRDLGISAFRGRNAREGALRSFLDAAELGIIPKGSYLLVESLDRISRDEILSAQALFLQIIAAGIVLVTLIDGRTYSRESLNANPCNLIISLVSMMRANEESATKSLRNRAAWEAKRAKARTEPMTARCPGWLRLDKATGCFEVLETPAEVVRRIYRDTLAGIGQQSIARTLNREGVPLFGGRRRSGKFWHRAFIAHIQRNPAVTGTLTPRVTEWESGKLHLRALAPVPGYYPSIISPETFQQVQDVLNARAARCGPPQSAHSTGNILAHLARCPVCDGPMSYTSSGNPDWRYLTCTRARARAGCFHRSVRYADIESAITGGIGAIIAGCPRPAGTPSARKQRLRWIAGRLRYLQDSRAEINSGGIALRQFRAARQSRIEAIVAEITALEGERRGLRADPPRWPNLRLEARLGELRHAMQPERPDMAHLNSALRALLLTVTIDYERSRLVCAWKHGGASEVAYQERRRRAAKCIPGG